MERVFKKKNREQGVLCKMWKRRVFFRKITSTNPPKPSASPSRRPRRLRHRLRRRRRRVPPPFKLFPSSAPLSRLSLSLSTQSTHPPPPHGSGELAAGDRRRNPRVSSCVRGRWFCSNDRRWWCRRQPPLPPPARSGGHRLGFGGRCHPLPSIPSSPTFR